MYEEWSANSGRPRIVTKNGRLEPRQEPRALGEDPEVECLLVEEPILTQPQPAEQGEEPDGGVHDHDGRRVRTQKSSGSSVRTPGVSLDPP